MDDIKSSSEPIQQGAVQRESSTPPYPPYPFFPSPEEEVNILDLLRVLWNRKWLLTFITVLGTCGAVAYALLATPIYRAQAVIAPPEQKKTGAASAALAAFGGIGAELAGSMGISLGGADANRLEALLRSRRLLQRVVRVNNLLPILFDDEWDQEKKTWLAEDPEDIPTFWDAEKALEDIYTVENDSKLGVIRVAFEWKAADIAKKVLSSTLSELATLMQEDELKKIDANRRFAEEQLRTAKDPVIVSKLQALLSEQVEKAMMAGSVEQFAYELIDPPAASDEKVKPKRALVCILGLVCSATISILVILGIESLKKVKSQPTQEGATSGVS